MPASLNRLRDHARKLGCPDLLWLDSLPTPEHINYLDLLPSRSGAPVLPRAVAEFQGKPLLFLLDGLDETSSLMLQPNLVQDVQCLLANRSEHACLGVARPGALDVYPINLDRRILAKAKFRTILLADPGAPSFFQSLATGNFELSGRPNQADYVFDTIHNLLRAASETLAGKDDESGPMRGLDVLSTTGRALFFRFLIDRGIVLPSEITDISPSAKNLRGAFSDPEIAAATSCWLDETFNGDLLPLVDGLQPAAPRPERLRCYRRFYQNAGRETHGALFQHLQAILCGWEHVANNTFQMTFDVDWSDFNFAHIPIGVLSQVYETFSHQWDVEHAEKTSVYYTPRNLAKLLVEEAFAGVKDPAEAVVLDPACGAGVFMVLAFRHLVKEHWRKNGIRPDTRTIQRILYKQLRGFEVSESALRLTALSLYISAIEVNPTPRPPKSLKFPRPLRGEVLFNFDLGESRKRQPFMLGSLASDVPEHFNAYFDIVVTNPPWTRLRAKSRNPERKASDKRCFDNINAHFTSLTRRVLRSRGLEDLADKYENPDYNPDLPFIWRSAEWAKPGGIIAMALPARIILKQTPKAKCARDAILKGLSITGILNGSDLEKTPVWPNMDLPFMLLFARNTVPRPNHHFHFVTPVRENKLSRRGWFRLDFKSAQPVTAADVISKPWLLKALAIGTALDADIVDKLPPFTVGQFWKQNRLQSGKGYDLYPGKHAVSDILDLKDFVAPSDGFSLTYEQLTLWRNRHKQRMLHRAPDVELYKPPIVIIPEAPRETRAQPKAFVSWTNSIAFSRSNYGYSTNKSPDAQVLAATLYLVIHSSIFQYFCLIRSSRQGASFRTILKEDVDNFPFPGLTELSFAERKYVLDLASRLETANSKPWEKIDEFVFKMYHLDEHDKQVVSDTVEFGGPYQIIRQHAEEPVPREERESFCRYLESMLQPLFAVVGQRIAVALEDQKTVNGFPAWCFLSVALSGENLQPTDALMRRLAADANRTGSSRVIVRVPDSGLLIGILNARRYWSKSRARLCSLHIEQHHMDAFPVSV